MAAARAALELVEAGEVLGVGTGSTANCFIDLVAEERAADVAAAVASSEETARRLRDRGIRVVDLHEVPGLEPGAGGGGRGAISVYIDGADEFDPALCLIKGGGGALTREKVVAWAARRFVCIVDESKRVDVLGAFPLPVEVIPMARPLVARKLRDLGGEPRLREGFVTDNGNEILDVHGLQIEDPEGLEADLDAYPGVVTCGIFARRRADVVLMAAPAGVERFEPPAG